MSNMVEHEFIQGPLSAEQQRRYDFDKSLSWRLQVQNLSKKIFWGTILTLPVTIPVAVAATIFSAGLTAPMTIGAYLTGLAGAGLTEKVFMPRSIENLFARGEPQGSTPLVSAYRESHGRTTKNVMKEVGRARRLRILSSPSGRF